MRVRCALLFGLALPLAGALRSAVGVRRLKMQESSSPYPSPLPPQWKEILDPSSGKPYYYNAATGVTQWQRPSAESFASYMADNDGARDLSPNTVWKIKLDLRTGSGAPTTISANLRFAEDVGFEPPQGLLSVESCVPEGALALGKQAAVWTLSEDPDDRGDSLWIWGLFKEPLYPFLLAQLELAAPIELAGGEVIPAGPLFMQIDHRRKSNSVQLGEGAVTYRVAETLKADLVGLSDFSYAEPISCGTVRFLDTADEISKSYV